MKPWIQAARLRTLPLAISGILLGCAQAYLYQLFNLEILIWGMVTAILLQILSNYANDYGDFLKGTDTKANRQDRALASGKISVSQMKIALFLLSIGTLISGLFLLSKGIEEINNSYYILLFIGILSIAAAIMYTVGKKAYGYYGFGDIFVFIFFGLVSVGGIFFLHTKFISSDAILASFGLGLLSTGVLNVNNMRDIITDKENGKNTLVVKMGIQNTLRYHKVLIWGGFVFTVASFLLHIKLTTEKVNQFEYLMLVASFGPIAYLLGRHMSIINELKTEQKDAYNKELKNLSLTILLFVIFYWLIAYLYAA